MMKYFSHVFLLSRSCNGLCWFPHYAWDEWCYTLVLSYVNFWYIHTLMGDGCMYESLVIGRSSHVLLVKHIFADLTYSQGEHEQHTSTEQRLQHVLRGSITLFPWWQRWGMTLSDLGLPSSPKGEIFGIMTQVWHYGTGVVLDGNSLRWKISI